MKEQTISLKVLNELMNPQTKNKYFLNKENGHFGVPTNSDGYMGEYNETFKFYHHPDMPENIFLKETYHTDSYGSGNYLERIEFVEGKAKQITVYEPIK